MMWKKSESSVGWVSYVKFNLDLPEKKNIEKKYKVMLGYFVSLLRTYQLFRFLWLWGV